MTTEEIKIPLEMQSYLDEHKEELSSEIYKQLSDLNMKQFKIKSNNFYKVTYITSNVHKFSRHVYQISPHKKTTYIKIPLEVYEKIQEHLGRGRNCIDCAPEFKIIKDQLFIEQLNINIEANGTCSNIECDECCEVEIDREIELINGVIITKIEKA